MRFQPDSGRLRGVNSPEFIVKNLPSRRWDTLVLPGFRVTKNGRLQLPEEKYTDLFRESVLAKELRPPAGQECPASLRISTPTLMFMGFHPHISLGEFGKQTISIK